VLELRRVRRSFDQWGLLITEGVIHVAAAKANSNDAQRRSVQLAISHTERSRYRSFKPAGEGAPALTIRTSSQPTSANSTGQGQNHAARFVHLKQLGYEGVTRKVPLSG
jgi:hypothetical protein